MARKIRNLETPNGRPAPNQIEVSDGFRREFWSYGKLIAYWEDGAATLDRDYWDYSNTTGRFRNQFLGETKKETEKKIVSGLYKLDYLNN